MRFNFPLVKQPLPWLATLSLVLLCGYISLYQWHCDDFTIIDGDGSRTIELPFLQQSIDSNQFVIKGLIYRRLLSPSHLRIIGDDEIQRVRINGHDLNISEIPISQRRDIVHGIKVDAGKWLTTGVNHIEVTVFDIGGMRAAEIRTGITSPTLIGLYGLAFLTLILWLVMIFRWRKVPLVQQIAYLLILLGAAVQVWYICAYNPLDHIWSDPARHWEQGTDVLRSDLMAMTDPILYQVYIAVLAKLTLKLPALVAFYTSLLALVGTWLWYRFFRELQPSKTIALYGWAVVSLLPSWTSIYAYFMQETLMIPLLGAALWATWRCRRKATQAAFMWMVLIWVLAGLTRGICIPMAAVCCTWLWFAQEQKLRKAVGSLALLFLFLAPLTYRSYEMVGLFAPHGMGQMNTVYAMSGKREIEVQSRRDGSRWGHGFGSPTVGASPFHPLSDFKSQRQGKVIVNVDFRKGSRDWDKARERINYTVGDYLWQTKENLIFIFFADSWPDTDDTRVYGKLSSPLRWLWAPFFVLTVVGLIVYRRNLRGQWLLPSMLMAWFVVQNLLPISVNEGRYRKPLEGLLIAHALLLLASRKSRPDQQFTSTGLPPMFDGDTTPTKQSTPHARN